MIAEDEFASRVEPHRRELHAYCYRMLGSVKDADDALQETLLGAWRGIDRFEGRSSLRTWPYTIATHACYRLTARRPRRVLASEHGPPRSDVHDLGTPITESVFLEPFPDDDLDPAERAEQRESVELAFVAALQHLPATQRAVLVMRDVPGFRASEVAQALETSVASVNSALQRARDTMARRAPELSQQAALRELGDDGVRELVDAFVSAWERGDVDVLVALLAEDARFTMPPLPAWFSGRDDIGRFAAERLFATPWRLVPIRVNGQLGFVCHQGVEGGDGFGLGAVNVLSLRGREIVEISGFVDPDVVARFEPLGKLEIDR